MRFLNFNHTEHFFSAAKEDTPLPIPNLTGRVLKKAFDFAEHHLKLEKNGEQKSEEWDIEFLKGEKGDWPTLQEILIVCTSLLVVFIHTIECVF